MGLVGLSEGGCGGCGCGGGGDLLDGLRIFNLSVLLMIVSFINTIINFKGTGHFFETLSVGSVSGTDHSFFE